MLIQFRPATMADIGTIQWLAASTWPATYSAIMTGRQMEYMLHMMYRQEVLEAQMQTLANHFTLATLAESDQVIGFYHIAADTVTPGRWKLNKIYLLPEHQGGGKGKAMLLHAEQEAVARGAISIYLQVNRQNKAKDFYEKRGYAIESTGDFAIGAGFYMNDYVMAKQLTP